MEKFFNVFNGLLSALIYALNLFPVDFLSWKNFQDSFPVDFLSWKNFQDSFPVDFLSWKNFQDSFPVDFLSWKILCMAVL